jgi:predicted ATPase
MRAVIERHEGTVEKFIGDAVVALFGVPRVREDDALRAVRAAADMRASLASLNAELESDLGIRLEIRIGVNTGEVIVGRSRAVLGAAGLTGDEPADAAEAAFATTLGNSPDTANVLTRLLALAGFDRDGAVPEDVPWAVRVFLEQLARQQPIVLVVDDLHWAQPGLLDVLEHIADWSREWPIMLVGLARPEFYESRPSWGGREAQRDGRIAVRAGRDRHDQPRGEARPA